VGIDASGSVDAAMLRLFAAQVAAIARRTGAEVHALVFDEAVRHTVRLTGAAAEAEVLRLRMVRGGGTSYHDLFARAQALDPAALVVLTDLEAALPPRPRRLPVIWAVPRAPRVPPPWGRVVTLDR
jgi:predicted metal-dependent peptidase